MPRWMSPVRIRSPAPFPPGVETTPGASDWESAPQRCCNFGRNSVKLIQVVDRLKVGDQVILSDMALLDCQIHDGARGLGLRCGDLDSSLIRPRLAVEGCA